MRSANSTNYRQLKLLDDAVDSRTYHSAGNVENNVSGMNSRPPTVHPPPSETRFQWNLQRGLAYSTKFVPSM